MDWMLMPFRRYAEFSGRSCRAEYWMFMLLQLIVMLGVLAPIFVFGGLSSSDSTGISDTIIVLFALVYFAVFFIPGIAVTIRRWHDLGQSGWFLLLFGVLNAIPIIGFIAGIVNIIWFCKQGDEGGNEYGENPLGPSDRY